MSQRIPGQSLYLYAFKRPVPLQVGPMSERDEYYVYAHSRVEALDKFKKNNPELYVDNPNFTPELLRRQRW